MQIKTFRAKSIQEALQIVRQRLGPDACVLDTREVRGGLTRRTMIEVDATSYPQNLSANETIDIWPEDSNLSQPSRDSSATKNRIVDRMNTTMPSESKSTQTLGIDIDEPNMAMRLLQQEQSDQLPQSVALGPSNQPIPSINVNPQPQVDLARVSGRTLSVGPAAEDVLNELMACGVEGELAAELVSAGMTRCAPEFRNDAWLIRGQVSQLIADRLKITKPGELKLDEQRIIAAVGPSGMGKTTLLARLAHQAYMRTDQQIGIIAMDAWRGGVVEELLQVAQQVSAEIEVVGAIDQLTPALQRLREFDLVLIDTMGRSPQDSTQLDHLRQLMHIAQPDESHLVLSASSGQSHIKTSLERFGAIGVTHMSIAKLDEASSLGHWISPLMSSPIPLQYLTSGHDFDKDMTVIHQRHLASLLLGQVGLQVS